MALTTKQIADFVSRLRQSAVWLDDGTVKLYLYCLKKASHNNHVWRGVHLQPGDMPLSEVNTAQALHWCRAKLRKRIRLLEAKGCVTLHTTQGVGTVLHLVDWPQNEAKNHTTPILETNLTENNADDSIDDSKLMPMWLQDDTNAALTGDFKTRPVRPHYEDELSKAEPDWPNHKDELSKMRPVRPHYENELSKTRPDWSQNDDVHPDKRSKTEPDWPQNGNVHPDSLSKTEPDWPHHETNPQMPIDHCQQKQTGLSESCSQFIQEMLPNQTSQAQTCLNDIQYPYNKYNRHYISNILPGYSVENEPVGFSDIWLAYPQHRRTHRGEAASLVEKALNEGATIGNIMAALEEAKQSMDWQNNDGQYIPGIVKWLQRESWRRYLPEDQPDDDEGDEPWVSR